MRSEEVIIVGGGPCGLAAAIAFQEKGITPLVIEKGNIVNAIYQYPTHQTFFSSSEKLEIGNVPFLTEEFKPKRNQALVYYRDVVKRKGISIHSFEKVESVKKQEDDSFVVTTTKEVYKTKTVIIATGYYDHPNMLQVPGEDLSHVYHYFKEAHPFFDQDIVVIGGKNSAVDAALELHKARARVTVIYRGSEYSNSIKPWILPNFDALVRNNEINMMFNTNIEAIDKEYVYVSTGQENKKIKAQHVFAMTGYHPDHQFLRKMGVRMDDETGRPTFNPQTMETNVNGIYIAGVIAAGNNANEIFIENGRFHGELIAKDAIGKYVQSVN
ncbi:YpdA family putative bacillithiol disulfide reductase [Mangrovibacillus cuniculi]|uniref:YpdA family putative bacillithiol disulfide reductase n=1 Tax=Mangrovibacillus cuniculi TaxID=2593652 RepID=A0A7S8CB60_9BACI|nr:YpdA family putative bacillithiol disulfide reductase [Mangrovibacillus cuniculi]QPC46722.1 YpdA family putative bacillithiol disulfide reductase [Mangrovibacillus cuniculi]